MKLLDSDDEDDAQSAGNEREAIANELFEGDEDTAGEVQTVISETGL